MNISGLVAGSPKVNDCWSPSHKGLQVGYHQGTSNLWIHLPGTCHCQPFPRDPQRVLMQGRDPWDPASAQTSPPVAQSRSHGRRPPAPPWLTARSDSRCPPCSAPQSWQPRTKPQSRARCRKTEPSDGQPSPRWAWRRHTWASGWHLWWRKGWRRQEWRAWHGRGGRSGGRKGWGHWPELAGPGPLKEWTDRQAPHLAHRWWWTLVVEVLQSAGVKRCRSLLWEGGDRKLKLSAHIGKRKLTFSCQPLKKNVFNGLYQLGDIHVEYQVKVLHKKKNVHKISQTRQCN